MSYDRAVTGGPDLKGVEAYLLGLPDVMDASVWISNGRLMAHVTVPQGASVVPNSFRAACLRDLGAHLTPEEVYLIVDHELVA